MSSPAAADLTLNRVLASLPSDQLGLAAGHIRTKSLVHDVVIYGQGQRVDDLIFPLTGMISMIREFKDGQAVEVAALGPDGVTGLPLRGDGRNIGARTAVQIAGVFAFLDVRSATEMCAQEPGVLDVFDRATQVFMATLLITAACNRAHDVHQRLARWLLVGDDAIGGQIRLTHEYLATMVGVQRPTVTIAAGELQADGVISYKRGRITVLDREELETRACECHEAITAIRDRILPLPVRAGREHPGPAASGGAAMPSRASRAARQR